MRRLEQLVAIVVLSLVMATTVSAKGTASSSQRFSGLRSRPTGLLRRATEPFAFLGSQLLRANQSFERFAMRTGRKLGPGGNQVIYVPPFWIAGTVGFSVAVWGIAVLHGNPVSGALMMAGGAVPMLVGALGVSNAYIRGSEFDAFFAHADTPARAP